MGSRFFILSDASDSLTAVGGILQQHIVCAAVPHGPRVRGDPTWDSNGRAEPAHFKVLPGAKRLNALMRGVKGGR